MADNDTKKQVEQPKHEPGKIEEPQKPTATVKPLGELEEKTANERTKEKKVTPTAFAGLKEEMLKSEVNKSKSAKEKQEEADLTEKRTDTVQIIDSIDLQKESKEQLKAWQLLEVVTYPLLCHFFRSGLKLEHINKFNEIHNLILPEILQKTLGEAQHGALKKGFEKLQAISKHPESPLHKELEPKWANFCRQTETLHESLPKQTPDKTTPGKVWDQVKDNAVVKFARENPAIAVIGAYGIYKLFDSAYTALFSKKKTESAGKEPAFSRLDLGSWEAKLTMGSGLVLGALALGSLTGKNALTDWLENIWASKVASTAKTAVTEAKDKAIEKGKKVLADGAEWVDRQTGMSEKFTKTRDTVIKFCSDHNIPLDKLPEGFPTLDFTTAAKRLGIDVNNPLDWERYAKEGGAALMIYELLGKNALKANAVVYLGLVRAGGDSFGGEILKDFSKIIDKTKNFVIERIKHIPGAKDFFEESLEDYEKMSVADRTEYYLEWLREHPAESMLAFNGLWLCRGIICKAAKKVWQTGGNVLSYIKENPKKSAKIGVFSAAAFGTLYLGRKIYARDLIMRLYPEDLEWKNADEIIGENDLTKKLQKAKNILVTSFDHLREWATEKKEEAISGIAFEINEGEKVLKHLKEIQPQTTAVSIMIKSFETVLPLLRKTAQTKEKPTEDHLDTIEEAVTESIKAAGPGEEAARTLQWVGKEIGVDYNEADRLVEKHVTTAIDVILENPVKALKKAEHIKLFNEGKFGISVDGQGLMYLIVSGLNAPLLMTKLTYTAFQSLSDIYSPENKENVIDATAIAGTEMFIFGRATLRGGGAYMHLFKKGFEGTSIHTNLVPGMTKGGFDLLSGLKKALKGLVPGTPEWSFVWRSTFEGLMPPQLTAIVDGWRNYHLRELQEQLQNIVKLAREGSKAEKTAQAMEKIVELTDRLRTNSPLFEGLKKMNEYSKTTARSIEYVKYLNEVKESLTAIENAAKSGQASKLAEIEGLAQRSTGTLTKAERSIITIGQRILLVANGDLKAAMSRDKAVLAKKAADAINAAKEVADGGRATQDGKTVFETAKLARRLTDAEKLAIAAHINSKGYQAEKAAEVMARLMEEVSKLPKNSKDLAKTISTLTDTIEGTIKAAEVAKAASVAAKTAEAAEAAKTLNAGAKAAKNTETALTAAEKTAVVAKAAKDGAITAEKAAQAGITTAEVVVKGKGIIKIAMVAGQIIPVVAAGVAVGRVAYEAYKLHQILADEAMYDIAKSALKNAEDLRNREKAAGKEVIDQTDLPQKLIGAREIAVRLHSYAVGYGIERRAKEKLSTGSQIWHAIERFGDTIETKGAGAVADHAIEGVMSLIYGSNDAKLKQTEEANFQLNIEQATHVLRQLRQVESPDQETLKTIEALEQAKKLAEKCLEKGKPPTPEEADSVHKKIRDARSERETKELAKQKATQPLQGQDPSQPVA